MRIDETVVTLIIVTLHALPNIFANFFGASCRRIWTGIGPTLFDQTTQKQQKNAPEANVHKCDTHSMINTAHPASSLGGWPNVFLDVCGWVGGGGWALGSPGEQGSPGGPRRAQQSPREPRGSEPKRAQGSLGEHSTQFVRLNSTFKIAFPLGDSL